LAVVITGVDVLITDFDNAPLEASIEQKPWR
jgi:hypothetical protein